MTPQIEILNQLTRGPVWDGNLVSKDARDALFRAGLVGKHDGWNFLTSLGVSVCIGIGLLRP